MRYAALLMLCGMAWGQVLESSDGWCHTECVAGFIYEKCAHGVTFMRADCSGAEAPILLAELPDQIPRITVDVEDKAVHYEDCDPRSLCRTGPDAEPVDVPAILEMGGGFPCPIDRSLRCNEEMVWTCADKRRILLTSEDGKKHCIKFRF